MPGEGVQLPGDQLPGDELPPYLVAEACMGALRGECIAGISGASRNPKHGSLLTSTRSIPSDYDFSPEDCIVSLSEAGETVLGTVKLQESGYVDKHIHMKLVVSSVVTHCSLPGGRGRPLLIGRPLLRRVAPKPWGRAVLRLHSSCHDCRATFTL